MLLRHSYVGFPQLWKRGFTCTAIRTTKIQENLNLKVLNVESRLNDAKGFSKRLRQNGQLPCAIYGKGPDGENSTINVTFKLKDLQREIRLLGPSYQSVLYKVILDNKEEIIATMRDAQLDPVTDIPFSVRFMRFRPGNKIRIPVVYSNREASPGLKRGGYMNYIQRDIVCVCDSWTFPSSFKIDVSGLNVGDHIPLSLISFPEGVYPHNPDKKLVATIGGRSSLRGNQTGTTNSSDDATEKDEK